MEINKAVAETPGNDRAPSRDSLIATQMAVIASRRRSNPEAGGWGFWIASLRSQ
jgi:hypothetical protein